MHKLIGIFVSLVLLFSIFSVFADTDPYQSLRIYKGQCTRLLAYSSDVTSSCQPIFVIIRKDDKTAYININLQDQTLISISSQIKKDGHVVQFMPDALTVGTNQSLQVYGDCSLSQRAGGAKFQCNLIDQNMKMWLFEYDHVSLINETLK